MSLDKKWNFITNGKLSSWRIKAKFTGQEIWICWPKIKKKIVTVYSETFFCILEGEWFENFFFSFCFSFFFLMYVCNYLWSRNEPTWKGENTASVATKVQPGHHQAWGNFMSILAHTVSSDWPVQLRDHFA